MTNEKKQTGKRKRIVVSTNIKNKGEENYEKGIYETSNEAGMVATMALTTVACGGSADNSASTDKAEAPAEDHDHLQESVVPKMIALMMNVHYINNFLVGGGDSRHTATKRQLTHL